MNDSTATPRSGLATLALLTSKLTLAQFAPVVLNFFVFGLMGKLGGLYFATFSQVATINMTALSASIGVLTALYPLAGRELGAGDQAAYRRVIADGMALALLLALPLLLVSLAAGWIVEVSHNPPPVVALAHQIGWVAALGVIPNVLTGAYRMHFSMSGRAGLISIIYSVGSVLTVLLAIMAVAAAKGDAVHASLAITGVIAATNWLMFGACWLCCRQQAALKIEPLSFLRRVLAGRAGLLRLLAVGWPIGMVFFLEAGALLFSSLTAGAFGLTTGDAHLAGLQWLGVCLVLPLGLGQACSQIVAIHDGSGELTRRNAACWQAIGLGAVLALFVTAAFALWPLQAASLLLGPRAAEPQLAALLRGVMPATGVLFLFETIIIVSAAALRGIGVTRSPLALSVVGYGLFTAGGIWLAAIVLGHGLLGVWIGLLGGFGITTIAVLLRCRSEFRLPGNRPEVAGDGSASSLTSPHLTTEGAKA
ncbi:MATE family efflux transporter [Parachitinimonas caeni]|uniref:MATE family efflux transporter n=1 Tax=Parachitinimonas caeni TaxID=3031301 RepID=A0ABT7E0V2_9NEIS|nr:MATE family efflux transporter [Parachitinimonas caeni]MDK2125942.1 MATE family efflux transporter [Parachitinimonas caeni]